MDYVSTRGEAPVLGFKDVLLAGLARDGGLYLPAVWPRFTEDEIRAMRGMSYADIAYRVISRFVDGEVAEADLRAMIADAYGAFRHQAVTPLVQTGDNDWLLELFHGPTLAFKDIAMRLLARLMDHVLEERGERATVIGATSGDTGGAAIDAFAGRARTDIFILFPDGGVSDVQRRQMTTVMADNVHTLSIRGHFDDGQRLVKAMFNDHAFRDRLQLAGVNSINWARIMAQTVYYFASAVALGAPDRRISFTVPTGNFGDVLAGYVAKRMGLSIGRLVIATNVNDILVRALETGRYETAGVEKTISPSMDIQISSNFERLLFDAFGRDSTAVVRAMDGLKQSGGFSIDEAALAMICADFDAARSDEAETAETIRRTLAETGYLLDPHTAIGVCAAAKKRGDPAVPMVTLATAHPAKFPDAVETACGVCPALPDFLSGLLERPERIQVLDAEETAVKAHIKERTRVFVTP